MYMARMFGLFLCVFVLACEGPRGPVGPEGPQGPQGSQGPQGPQGPAAQFIIIEFSITSRNYDETGFIIRIEDARIRPETFIALWVLSTDETTGETIYINFETLASLIEDEQGLGLKPFYRVDNGGMLIFDPNEGFKGESIAVTVLP